MSVTKLNPLLSASLIFWLLLSAPLFASEPFTVEAIRVDGLQRIAVGTVFNYLPIKVGERIDDSITSDAIRALYKTGFFKDVAMEREDNTLIVFVAERPAIASIEIEGNEDIPKDQLTTNLEQLGLSEGKVLDRSLLDKVEQELKRQYLALGKYNVSVKSEQKPLERNRVAIRIEIYEGEIATIQRLNIVGNTVFDDATLYNEMQSGTAPAFSLFSDREKYSKQKLGGDLESLRSYYMDRGYINFDIDSTQVTITPDKQDVYLTINLNEGEQFTVREIKLAGVLQLPEAVLRDLITLLPGDIFSRRKVTESANRISERLGDDGFAFANVNPIPDIDKAQRQVGLTFFIDPGKRVSVRKIDIEGNVYTKDEVLRRELRQLESSIISTRNIKRSKTRLDRLGYFDQVNVETPAVAGTADLVDARYSVVEKDAFGSFNFGVGYGEAQGFLINTAINQENVFGTGNRINFSVNYGAASTSVNFNHINPYFTPDGVTRGYNLFYRTVDAGELETANYLTDTYGLGVSFGYPLNEDDSIRLALDYEHTKIYTDVDTSPEVRGFCIDNASVDECQFDNIKPSLSWTHDTRNRALFPTDGGQIIAAAEVAGSVGEYQMNYYKLRYKQTQFIGLSDKFTLAGRSELSYGDAYGETTKLPPFQRYFAGGIRTVRGYKINSLGPRDIDGDPLGGNIKVVGNLELLYVPPFAEKSDSSRLSLFFDAGNVYDGTRVELDELRLSTGISLQWFTPVGPLVFSYAIPLNNQLGDDVEKFQFSLGTVF